MRVLAISSRWHCRRSQGRESWDASPVPGLLAPGDRIRWLKWRFRSTSGNTIARMTEVKWIWKLTVETQSPAHLNTELHPSNTPSKTPLTSSKKDRDQSCYGSQYHRLYLWFSFRLHPYKYQGDDSRPLAYEIYKPRGSITTSRDKEEEDGWGFLEYHQQASWIMFRIDSSTWIMNTLQRLWGPASRHREDAVSICFLTISKTWDRQL